MNRDMIHSIACTNKWAQLWIIRLPDGMFVKHPRGEQTRFRHHAYGYVYKKEAKQNAPVGATVERRGKLT